VDVTQRAAQRTFPVRYHDQVRVVRHQAVSEDGQSLLFRVLLQESEIHQAVVVGLEYHATAVAALRDVVRRLQHLYSRQSCHIR
jgi:hypothetical protein